MSKIKNYIILMGLVVLPLSGMSFLSRLRDPRPKSTNSVVSGEPSGVTQSNFKKAPPRPAVGASTSKGALPRSMVDDVIAKALKRSSQSPEVIFEGTGSSSYQPNEIIAQQASYKTVQNPIGQSVKEILIRKANPQLDSNAANSINTNKIKNQLNVLKSRINTIKSFANNAGRESKVRGLDDVIASKVQFDKDGVLTQDSWDDIQNTFEKAEEIANPTLSKKVQRKTMKTLDFISPIKSALQKNVNLRSKLKAEGKVSLDSLDPDASVVSNSVDIGSDGSLKPREVVRYETAGFKYTGNKFKEPWLKINEALQPSFIQETSVPRKALLPPRFEESQQKTVVPGKALLPPGFEASKQVGNLPEIPSKTIPQLRVKVPPRPTPRPRNFELTLTN